MKRSYLTYLIFIAFFSFSLLFSNNNGPLLTKFEDKNIEIIFPCKYSSNKKSLGRGGSSITYTCEKDKIGYALTITTIYDPSRKSAKIALKGHLNAMSLIAPLDKVEWFQRNNYTGVEYKQSLKTSIGQIYNYSKTFYIKGQGYHFMVIDKNNNKKLVNKFLSSIKIKS